MMTNKTNLKKSFMSNNRKKVKLTKVNIISLIDMLKKIYDDGADYIDIEGVPTDGEEDSITTSCVMSKVERRTLLPGMRGCDASANCTYPASTPEELAV